MPLKLTKSKLKQLIKEEINIVLNEELTDSEGQVIGPEIPPWNKKERLEALANFKQKHGKDPFLIIFEYHIEGFLSPDRHNIMQSKEDVEETKAFLKARRIAHYIDMKEIEEFENVINVLFFDPWSVGGSEALDFKMLQKIKKDFYRDLMSIYDKIIYDQKRMRQYIKAAKKKNPKNCYAISGPWAGLVVDCETKEPICIERESGNWCRKEVAARKLLNRRGPGSGGRRAELKAEIDKLDKKIKAGRAKYDSEKARRARAKDYLKKRRYEQGKD